MTFISSIARFLNAFLSAYAQGGAHTHSRRPRGSSDSLFDKNLGSIWIPRVKLSTNSCLVNTSSRTIFTLSDVTGIDNDVLLDIFKGQKRGYLCVMNECLRALKEEYPCILAEYPLLVENIDSITCHSYHFGSAKTRWITFQLTRFHNDTPQDEVKRQNIPA